MNGHHLNSGNDHLIDITDTGALTIRNNKESAKIGGILGKSLIVSRGNLILDGNIRVNDGGAYSYSDGVISALKGSLEIRGNVSVLQGPEGGPLS